MLIICQTHPVPYHAPVYRELATKFTVPVVIAYGSDFSVSGYHDPEFGVSFAWDTDLTSGVNSHFVSRVSNGGAATREALTSVGLAAALESLVPTAILAHGYVHPFDRKVIFWALRNKVPLLLRGETSDHATQRQPLKRILRDMLLRWLYHRCAALLYVGIRSKVHYERLGVPSKKLFFSPYCVDATAFKYEEVEKKQMRHETRQAWGIKPDATVILYSGKLSPRKGVDLIGEAVRLLPTSQQANLHILFLGDGELRSQLEQEFLHQFPVIPTTFTGFQNQTQLSSFYHAADMLVLPSRHGETWGLVVNEALLHGLPCVVSDQVGCQPDLIEPGVTGQVCVGGNAKSLSEAISQTLILSREASTSQKCRERVERYNVHAAAESIDKAWHFVTKA